MLFRLNNYNFVFSITLKTLLTALSLHRFSPNRFAHGLKWLVLMVILLGMAVSSFGSTISHGIAAVAMAGVGTSALADTQHGHEHGHGHEHVHQSAGEHVDAKEHAFSAGESALSPADDGAPLDHPHHGADHSHDPAHALMAKWGSFTSEPPGWLPHALPWVEALQPYRLERPPIA